MRIQNENGSILVVTVGFALVFTMLGLGSIQMAGLQNETAEKRKASAEALWLADGAVDRARSKLPATPLTLATQTIDSYHSYDVSTALKFGYQHRWDVTAHSNVSNGTTSQKRGIAAVVSDFNIANALTTNGCVNNCTGDPAGSASANPVEQNAGFTFFSIFGIPYSDIRDNPVGAYTVTRYTDNLPANNSGITLVTISQNRDIKINSNPNLGSGLLIIDCSLNDPGDNCVDMNGSPSFNGIIWIIGNVGRYNGTPDIHGTIFIEGSTAEDLSLRGNFGVTYDETAIYNAIGSMGGIPPNPAIISWKEI